MDVRESLKEKRRELVSRKRSLWNLSIKALRLAELLPLAQQAISRVEYEISLLEDLKNVK